MSKVGGNGSSPVKKWTGLLEKTEKKKEIELQKKALAALAKTEHEMGKIFLDFFIACFNLIIYHRGLHSKSFFAVRECHRFGMQIPYMRFPETIVYLEKVTEKGVNCLMSDLLEGFIFEERDRFGNTIMFMFKLHGSARITSTTLIYTADVLTELTTSCEELLHELIRTLTSIPPILQPNMFRWKIELGLKKVDKPDSKWDVNKQGIFDDDPDWKIFPWLRNVRGARRRDSFQELESSGSTVSAESTGLIDQNPITKPDEETDKNTESNGAPKANSEESVDEDFFDTNNFHDVTLEEDMGSPVITDYEKEGLSIIEYDDESQQQEENNEETEDRPSSPDMFADSPQPQTPSTTSGTTQSSRISYHMENLEAIQNGIHVPYSTKLESKLKNDAVSTSMDIDGDHSNRSPKDVLENTDDPTIFTQTDPDSPRVVSLESSKSALERDKSVSPDEFQDVTTIYEDFEDFDDLDKVLELADSDEPDISESDLDLINGTLLNSEPAKGVKFYCAATSKMLDTLVCNVLIFKDTNADELHSDYKPHVAKKKMKRTSDNESS